MKFKEIMGLIGITLVLLLLVGMAVFIVLILSGYQFPGDIARDKFCLDNGFEKALDMGFGGSVCQKIEGNNMIQKRFIHNLDNGKYYFITQSGEEVSHG